MSGEVFNLYLHQNYLDFFSEVDDVAQASKYLSDADLLTACWMVSLLWLFLFLALGATPKQLTQLQSKEPVNLSNYK